MDATVPQVTMPTYDPGAAANSPDSVTAPERDPKARSHGHRRRTATPRVQVDTLCLSTYYLFMTDINTRALDRELKRGSADARSRSNGRRGLHW
jgi:hypothetical protein